MMLALTQLLSLHAQYWLSSCSCEHWLKAVLLERSEMPLLALPAA